MGTRSLTVVKDQYSDGENMVMYRQFDGYPTGHGKELADFLKGKSIVNGLSGDTSMVFNGAGCLAASIVTHFKAEAGSGGFYLYPSGSRDIGENYVYTLTVDDDFTIHLKVDAGYGDNFDTIYDGKLEDFDPETVEKEA
jgi:hypothetical protein